MHAKLEKEQFDSDAKENQREKERLRGQLSSAVDRKRQSDTSSCEETRLPAEDKRQTHTSNLAALFEAKGRIKRNLITRSPLKTLDRREHEPQS